MSTITGKTDESLENAVLLGTRISRDIESLAIPWTRQSWRTMDSTELAQCSRTSHSGDPSRACALLGGCKVKICCDSQCGW